jgi:hypothetical protein
LNTTGRWQRELRFRSMECYRRAMLPEQTLEGREVNLIQAAKFTRANAAVVEALAKHRNKGGRKSQSSMCTSMRAATRSYLDLLSCIQIDDDTKSISPATVLKGASKNRNTK